MKLLFGRTLLLCIVFSHGSHAENNAVITAQSPENRVALLELYTSEGCSSCPPAEQWLSGLKKSGVSSQQLIPLAFHVTYWDYIGWRDRFASDIYDQRQRGIARYNTQKTIYTPQFVLSGDDYRTYNQFSSDVHAIVSQKSVVGLKLSAREVDDMKIDAELYIDMSRSEMNDVALFITIYEDDISVNVEDGENEGKLLHHDYVVRQLYGPFIKQASAEKVSLKQSVTINKNWKRKDLHLVAFAQSTHTGEVLQAVRLMLGE